MIDETTPIKPRPRGARVLRKKKDGSDEGATSSAHRPSVTHGYFKSFDGTKLFYSIEGEGVPLIFCYGLICSSLHWTYQIDYFRKHYQSVWFDYRGHQNSEVPADLSSMTIENIACDLGALMNELKIEKAVLLGHSMGVNVLLDFFRQQPQRVAGMVLANGTAARPLETMFRVNATQAGFEGLRKLYDIAPGLVAKLWKSQEKNPLIRSLVSIGGFNPHLTAKADIDLYLHQCAEMDAGVVFSLIENYHHHDATSWLHTIDVPTLIIAGDNDNIIPLEQQQLLHQLIPNSELEVIKHGSHCPQMDLPELANLKIEKWLKKIGYVSDSKNLQKNPTP